MHFRFLDDLNAFLAATYSAPEVKATADLCPPEFVGDVTVSCFPLAKLLRRNPMQLAPAVRDFLAKHPDVQQAEAIKAFVNITLPCHGQAGSESVIAHHLFDLPAYVVAVHGVNVEGAVAAHFRQRSSVGCQHGAARVHCFKRRQPEALIV